MTTAESCCLCVETQSFLNESLYLLQYKQRDTQIQLKMLRACFDELLQSYGRYFKHLKRSEMRGLIPPASQDLLCTALTKKMKETILQRGHSILLRSTQLTRLEALGFIIEKLIECRSLSVLFFYLSKRGLRYRLGKIAFKNISGNVNNKMIQSRVQEQR